MTEGSACGSFLTIVCYVSVAVLVAFEFNNYLSVESKIYETTSFLAKTDYIIEQHSDEYIRINFDITMTRLSCDLASLDVVNQMGTHKV